MSEITDFTAIVFSKFDKTITDKIFLFIQNDKELMSKYLRLIEIKSLDTVNQQIGKAIKKRFNLENIIEREYEPISTLIKSHQQFE
ncbi:MAG: hypothetical protein M0R44_08580 [Candidatus Marinimicrobia bacterium]|jgi:hypothetical protein|nr:hypothetical protein [Candidatus Neomarinimicrobiota bacterium]